MPVTWTISHATRTVTVVARDKVSLIDMQAYLDDVMVAGAMGYRKVFDLTQSDLDLDEPDLMALAARVRAYASTTPMGPLALVAATPDSYIQARLYMNLAGADRPMQLFSDAASVRKWLDAQGAAKQDAPK